MVFISPVVLSVERIPFRNLDEKRPHPEYRILEIFLISSGLSLSENDFFIRFSMAVPPSEKIVSHFIISSTSDADNLPLPIYGLKSIYELNDDLKSPSIPVISIGVFLGYQPSESTKDINLFLETFFCIMKRSLNTLCF